MVRAGIDETSAMQTFRVVCVRGQGGQQGNTRVRYPIFMRSLLLRRNDQ